MANESQLESKSRHYHHGDLHSALIGAARTLLLEKGPNAFSLREVAKTAGVSHAAPYRHFKDRNELLSEIAERGFRRLADELERVAQDIQDPQEQLFAITRIYVSLSIESPEITQLMFGGYLHQDDCSESLAVTSNRAYAGLLKIIENGQRAGIYVNQETDALALAVWSMVHGFSLLLIGQQIPAQKLSGPNAVEKLSDMLTDLLFRGIQHQ